MLAMHLNIVGCVYGLLAAGLLIGLFGVGLRKRWLARIALGIGLAAIALEPMAGSVTLMRMQMKVLDHAVVHGWPAYYARQFGDIALPFATMGLIIVGYAGLWLLDPKRERKESVQ